MAAGKDGHALYGREDPISTKHALLITNIIYTCSYLHAYSALPCTRINFYSAGVGRTGTLIAIDIALSQASKEKLVDIPKIIVDMRRQRMKMVQTVVSI